MTPTTTGYGEYDTVAPGGLTVAATVRTVLGAIDAPADLIDGAYREAINEALPEGVSLHGDVFYGPYPRPDGQPVQAVAEAVESVDLLHICEMLAAATRPLAADDQLLIRLFREMGSMTDIYHDESRHPEVRARAGRLADRHSDRIARLWRE